MPRVADTRGAVSRWSEWAERKQNNSSPLVLHCSRLSVASLHNVLHPPLHIRNNNNLLQFHPESGLEHSSLPKRWQMRKASSLQMQHLQMVRWIHFRIQKHLR